MSTITADRGARQKPFDGQEFLREDYENIISDAQEDTGNALADNDATRTINPGGIISGLTLSTTTPADNKTIQVAAGTAYDRNMTRIDETVSTSLDVTDATDYEGNVITATSGYVVALVTIIDDLAAAATHPLSGATDYKRKKVSTSIKLTTTTPPVAGNLVAVGRVYLGSFSTAGGLRLFDRAYKTVSSGADLLTIYPYDSTAGVTATIQEVRGVAGNKYWVRFAKEIGTAVSVVESLGPTLTASHYLDVTIPTDSTGTVVATFGDVQAAIFACTTFTCTFGAGGDPTHIFAGASYLDYYEPLTYGFSYRQHYQAKVGSFSLYPSVADRFTPDDPYTKHLMGKGHEAMTENNPHGTGIDDIAGLAEEMQDHQRGEHNRQRSGISVGSYSPWLGMAINSPALGSITVANPAFLAYSRAIIDGKVVTGITGSNVISDTISVGTLKEYTAEIVMASSGLLMMRKVADWATGTAHDIDTITNDSAISIIDKDPKLTGVFNLSIDTDTAEVTLGAGPAVTALVGNTYTLYNEYGNWVQVHIDDNPWGGGPGVVLWNAITFLASEQNDTTISLGFACWTNKAATPWMYYLDKRPYGTMSVEHDAYEQAGDILGHGCRYVGDTLLSEQVASTYLRPFEVDYRGRTYRLDKTALAGITPALNPAVGVYNYLAVRFDGAKNPVVVNLGATLFGSWDQSTDVLIGNLIHDGAGIPDKTTSLFFRQTSDKGYIGTTIKVSLTDEYGWNIDDALRYITTVCSDPTLYSIAVFQIELLSSVTSTVATATVGKILFKGNGYILAGNTDVTAGVVLADNIVFGSGFRFSQIGTISLASFDRTIVAGAYADNFLDVSATGSSVTFNSDCTFTLSGGFPLVGISGGSSVVTLDRTSWAGAGAATNMVKAETAATSVTVRMLGNLITSTGTVLQLNANVNVLDMIGNKWTHIEGAAAAAPILCSGTAAPALPSYYNFKMHGNSLVWTLTQAGSTDMIRIADSGVGDDIRVSVDMANNDAYLAYEATVVDPTLFHVSNTGVVNFTGNGLKFSGNTYHVLAVGAIAYASAFKVFFNEIPKEYSGSGTGLFGSNTYDCINEKIILRGLTKGAIHTVGVACVDSSYRVDGLEYVVDDTTVARFLGIDALPIGVVYNDVVSIQNVLFPPPVLAANVVTSQHLIDAEAVTSVVASNIMNVCNNGAHATDWDIHANYGHISVSGVSGKLSGAAGVLVATDVNSKTDYAVFVSGCHAVVKDGNVNGLTAALINGGGGGGDACLMGCRQVGGAAAIHSGFDDATLNTQVAV